MFYERTLARLESKLDLLLNLQRYYGKKGLRAMSAISDAVAVVGTKVTNLTSVVDSAEALLAGLSQQVKDLAAQLSEAGDIPAAIEGLNALSSAIDEQSGQLSSAVAANTPAAPPTP